MNKIQLQVEEFHRAFNLGPATNLPQIPPDHICDLRVNLIEEEFDELQLAFKQRNIVDVADALGDLLYVVFGTALTCGLNMEPIVDEIHRSNMTKKGGHRREDGKWIKPVTYEKAQLVDIINKQKRG